jgi:integrase
VDLNHRPQHYECDAIPYPITLERPTSLVYIVLQVIKVNCNHSVLLFYALLFALCENGMPKLSTTVITKSVIDRAKPGEVRDAGLRGFILRVYPTGKKVFFVQLERGHYRKVGDVALLTLTAARHKAKEMQVKHNSGEIVDSLRSVTPTLKSFLEGKYLDEIRLIHKQPEASVSRNLSSTKYLSEINLHKLNEFDIRKWKKSRMDSGISKSTFNRDLAMLKSALNIAVDLGLIIDNPTQKIKLFRNANQPRIRYLTPDEKQRLISALQERDREMRVGRESSNVWRLQRRKKSHPPYGEFVDYLEPLILLILNTGLRRNEALSLTWEKIKLQDNPHLTVHWKVAKSQKSRHIPLNKTAVDYLQKWRDQTSDKGLVFHRDGKQMHDIRTSWKNLMKRAKIENFRFHDLRHDFASQLVINGVDLYRVKELLGHASIEMTQRYAHLSPAVLADAVAALE